LWSRLSKLGEIGATPAGGVNRQALTTEDAVARAMLARWARERGFAVATDAIGNLFVRRVGTLPGLEPILTGSHLDTQPTGGRFDGVYGVVAAFEVLEALEDAHITTRRPVELVVWTNEEGCRFQPGCMGSSVFTRELPLAHALAAVDQNGTTVEAALLALDPPVASARAEAMPRPIEAYVEAHIEQGPRLEAEGRIIGVVTGIQGARWYLVQIEGEARHAGTTPMAGRKDAFKDALHIAAAMWKAVRAESDSIRFTVGRFNVWPNSPNTIPGRVAFTIDMRGPDESALERLSEHLSALCRDATLSCRVELQQTFRSRPQSFDDDLRRIIRDCASALDLPLMEMDSGAFHDALFLARHCRTGMIFVPCAKGISHNEAEDAKPQDLTAGTRTLADVVHTLANQ
jgi:N-carbamoyl-L-amino-acid hydrolase